MKKKTLFPIIALILFGSLLTGACTRQISAATPLVASAIPTLAVLLENTPTEAAFPAAVATVTLVPVKTEQPKEAETPLGFTATPTEYVVSPNLMTPVAANYENAPSLGKHVVQSYDSLESIARVYGVDPNAIKAANNLLSDAIIPGTTLIIPAVKWLNVTAGPISIPQFPTMYQNSNFSK